MLKGMKVHDVFFKEEMKDVDVARDFLQIHLPLALQGRCDFNTLQMSTDTFIEADKTHLYSDMVYSFKTKETEGNNDQGEGYVYCIVEHQSRPDKLMAFRLLRYSIAVMSNHLKQGHSQLPLVIPVLFYHGKKRPYPYSMDWRDCFSDPIMANQVIMNPFPLVDITVIPDSEILKHRRVAVLEMVMKHIWQRDKFNWVKDLHKALMMWPRLPEQSRSLLNYIGRAFPTTGREVIMEKLLQHSPDLQEQFVSLADSWKLEGIQEGKQEGRQEGRQEGKEETQLTIARRLLEDGLHPDRVVRATGIEGHMLAALQAG